MVVAAVAGLHAAQAPGFMRWSGHPLGLLINFNARLLKDGVKRFKI